MSPPPDLATIEAVTFDCYGTLIDWETGILDVLGPMAARRGLDVAPARLLELYAEGEARAETGPWRPYAHVLPLATTYVAGLLGFVPDADERGALARTLPDWPPFPDTVASLHRLARHVRLGILSNVDDALFAATAARLAVPFDWVVTAEQVRGYKPSPGNFHALLERVDVAPGALLHAAQSLYHDVAPASALGLATCHVRRRGRGATRAAAAAADLVVPDLAALADLLDAARAG